MGSIFRKMERQSLRYAYAELTKNYNNARRNDPSKFVGKRKVSFGMFIKNYKTALADAILKAKENVTAMSQQQSLQGVPNVPMKADNTPADLEWKED